MDGFDIIVVCAALFCAGWKAGETVQARRVDLHRTGYHRVVFDDEPKIYQCEPATTTTED